MANKVRFNLKNVHYATLNVAEDGAVTYGTPIHIPGAVSINLTPEGDTSTFYADGIAYYVAVANIGYSGDLEMALIPDDYRRDVLNEVESETDKVLTEYSTKEVKPHALLFEFDGDQNAIRHVFYNCTAARPAVAGGTTTGSKEPATETLALTAAPLSDGRVKAKTKPDTSAAVYNSWYNAVWEPATEIAEMAT